MKERSYLLTLLLLFSAGRPYRRYPLVPTMPSLVRTIEAASRSRINVIQLTVTRETAAWLARRDEDSGNQTTPASRRGGDVTAFNLCLSLCVILRVFFVVGSQGVTQRQPLLPAFILPAF